MRLTGETVHMDQGPIGRTLLAFAAPVLLSQLLQEIYSVTDCAVLGRFGGEYALAAAGVGGLILSMCINFIAIVLSVTGVLTPTTGALVHNEGSTFVVLLAALLYDRKYPGTLET